MSVYDVTTYRYGTLTVKATPADALAGGTVRISITCGQQDGYLADPATLTLVITAPDATSTTLQIADLTRDDTGLYHYVYTPAAPGAYTGNARTTIPLAVADLDFVVDQAAATWAPTNADVAALLPGRTVGSNGLPTGSFSASTIPSAAQVDLLIADVVSEVDGACRNIPIALYAQAKLVVILGAAWMVEVSLDDGVGSLAGLYGTRYSQALQRLQTACGLDSGLYWGVR